MLDNITLLTGMKKEKVNELVGDVVTFMDDEFLGHKHIHTWECKCGEIFNRKFIYVKFKNAYRCNRCISLKKRDEVVQYQVDRMKAKDDYDYYGTVITGELLSDGSVARRAHIRVRHKHCGTIYETDPNLFFRVVKNCPHCCKYEDSIANYIENELNLDINEVWDWDKNVVSPYYTHKGNYTNRIYIKCKEKDYHGSYETTCSTYSSGFKCGYCKPHHYTSEAHTYDSFGYHNFDKVQSWHLDNSISPFKVSCGSNRAFKFTCFECGNVFKRKVYEVARLGYWCTECSMSKGESKICNWLKYNNIKYEREKTFDGLMGVGGSNLRYDFYLPDYNILIEYQGEQHFEFIKAFHINFKGFKKQLLHDEKKREYAEKYNIKLLEIYYTDFEYIEEILDNKLKLINV